MVKIQKISEIEPCLGFTEFDMLKKYRQSFATSELGRLHSLFPFSELARQMHLKSSPFGRKSYFSPEGKIALMVLKSYTNFSGFFPSTNDGLQSSIFSPVTCLVRLAK